MSRPPSEPAPASAAGSTEASGPLSPAGRNLAESWLAAAALFPVLAIVLLIVVPPLVPPADPGAPARLFLPEKVGECAPNPLQQARYLASLVTAPVTFLAALLLLRGRIAARRLFLAAVVVELLVTAFVLAMWIAARQMGDPFPREAILAGLPRVGVVIAMVFVLMTVARKLGERGTAWLDRIPDLLVGTYVASQVLAVVFTEDTIAEAGGFILYHFPYWFREFSAIAQGRTPLVDFFPQYQSVLPWLALPVFRVFGTTATVFSSFVAAVSFVSIWLVYRALVRLCRDAGMALLLFTPFAGALFINGTFVYYAGGAFRLTLPFVVLWLLVHALDRPSIPRLVAVALGGGVAAVANFDFGFPAAVAAAAALVTSRVVRPLRATILAGGGLAAAIAGQTAACLLHSGQWPRFDRALDFQRAFAAGGFYGVPMPTWGLHWIVFAALLGGLFTALARWRTDEAGDPQRRIETGLLAFLSILGCGQGGYFAARSLPGNLGLVYPVFALVLGIMARRLCLDWRSGAGGWSREERTLRVLPLALLFAGLLLMATSLPPYRGVAGGTEGGRAVRARDLKTRQQALELARSHVRAGEPVIMVHRLEPELTRETSVENFYPFAMPGSLILRSQLEIVVETIRQRQVVTVLGSIPPSLVTAIGELGFVRVAGLGDFEVWKRSLPMTESPPRAGSPGARPGGPSR